ncbi:MAG TPA: hypothetical protein VMD91_01445 [Candidatus Sulfotelmatobacter sp.]|nr:hypothetical protein [Candidatus Sulfotelmatobacter sp.]
MIVAEARDRVPVARQRAHREQGEILRARDGDDRRGASGPR